MDIASHWLTIALVLASPWCAVWLWRRDVVAPGSLHRLAAAGRMRNPALVPAGAWLAAGVATYLGLAVGVGLVAALYGAQEPGHAALRDLGGYTLGAIVGFLCIAVLLRMADARSEDDARQLGLHARAGDALPGAGALLVTMPLCVAAATTAALLARWVSGEPPEQLAHSTLRELTADRYAWHAWLRSALVIIGAPVVEELIYRVFVQSAIISFLSMLRRLAAPPVAASSPLTTRPGDVALGIVLSTVLFVLPHAAALSGPVNWHALPSLAVLGLGLGVVYERTRSPLAPIVMHAGFNALNLGAAMLLT